MNGEGNNSGGRRKGFIRYVVWDLWDLGRREKGGGKKPGNGGNKFGRDKAVREGGGISRCSFIKRLYSN
jgi:hypothetical protein